MTDQYIDSPPPLIERFLVKGLHGYKNITIEFPGSARIVIAENGSGKTTVLTALSHLLNNNLYKLKDLPFESIEVKLTNHNTPLRIDRSEIVFGEHAEELFQQITEYSNASIPQITEAVFQAPSSPQASRLLENYYRRSPYNRDQVREQISNIRKELRASMPDTIQQVTSQIESALGDTNVLYLPTYRRIEAPLDRPGQSRKLRNRQRELDLFIESTWRSDLIVEPSDIQYGLSDVQARLKALAGEIQRISNIGYRRISANIIDDLLKAGVFDDGLSGSPGSALPDLDSLKLFLSRVEQQSPMQDRSKALEKLYEQNELNQQQNRTLRYFLSKLAVVVNETNELESNIASFVDRVNSYLRLSTEEKHLNYESSDMRVEVVNSWTGRVVDMDDLSSGEKQVISLFSYLYLYRGNNLILIDEPELSLSIEWQKKLLPDIVRTPTCTQLLAITHSPFIFDNELDPLAGPMYIERSKQSAHV